MSFTGLVGLEGKKKKTSKLGGKVWEDRERGCGRCSERRGECVQNALYEILRKLIKCLLKRISENHCKIILGLIKAMDTNALEKRSFISPQIHFKFLYCFGFDHDFL